MLVGLGNPGREYEKTRHNAGFLFIDYLAASYSLSFNKKKQYHYTRLYQHQFSGDCDLILVKPQTYMNLSGHAVKAAMNFFKVDVSRLMVFSDDVNLPLGRVRVRAEGSAGGQKGLKNIIELLSTDTFCRLRIGVGGSHLNRLEKHVLGRLKNDEMECFEKIFKKIEDEMKAISHGNVDDLMNQLNGLQFMDVRG